jgi:hypothetical protein
MSRTPYGLAPAEKLPIDWSLVVWLGVSDVAYMMVHWWDTELRQHYELPILQHYHHSLQRRGVENYAWEQLYIDYRLCAVQSIYVATEWCVDAREAQAMRWVWLPQLQKALQAYVDLQCERLWVPVVRGDFLGKVLIAGVVFPREREKICIQP